MNQIGDLLTKFKKLITSTGAVRENTTEVIFRLFKTKIEPKDIEFKDKILFIKASPLVRNEIFINKIKILEELEKKLGKDVVRNIK